MHHPSQKPYEGLIGPVTKRTTKPGTHKKSKNGCGTCKIRRVKCDEAKPTCLRCKKFGAKCDGYSEPAPKCKSTPRKPPLSSRERALLPNVVSLPSARSSITPFALRFETENEARYFTLFRDKTAVEISPHFVTQTWRTMVLQACEVPSIRHAAIAIGALDRASTVLQNQGGFYFKGDITDPSAHHKYAIEQYSKAIRHMRQDVSSGKQDLRTTLITSLFIVCFELYHGNRVLAEAQIQNAMALIEGWRKTYRDHKQHALGFVSPAPSIVETDLVRIFGRLDMQTNSLADTRPIEPHQKLKDEGGDLVRRMPNIFNSVEEAGGYLTLIMRRLTHWIYASALNTTTSRKKGTEASKAPSSPTNSRTVRSSWSTQSDSIDEALASQAVYKDELLQWKSSFDAYVERGKNYEELGATTIYLHYQSSYLAVMTSLATDDMIYDDYTTVMEDLVNRTDKMFKILLEKTNGRSIFPFTFDLGIVVPLYLVALKCRKSSLRRRAIQLLLTWPRREGLWDSVLAGKIGSWAQSIEEEFLEEETVPGWARVRQINSKLDFQRRRGDLSCQQRMADGGELVTRICSITW